MCEWWDGPIRNPSTTNLSPLDMKVGGNGPTIHYVPCCPIVSCWRLRKAPFPNANTSMDDDVYLLSFFFFSTNPFSNLSMASQFKWSARGLISRDDAGEFLRNYIDRVRGRNINRDVGRWLSASLTFPFSSFSNVGALAFPRNSLFAHNSPRPGLLKFRFL